MIKWCSFLKETTCWVTWEEMSSKGWAIGKCSDTRVAALPSQWPWEVGCGHCQQAQFSACASFGEAATSGPSNRWVWKWRDSHGELPPVTPLTVHEHKEAPRGVHLEGKKELHCTRDTLLASFSAFLYLRHNMFFFSLRLNGRESKWWQKLDGNLLSEKMQLWENAAPLWESLSLFIGRHLTLDARSVVWKLCTTVTLRSCVTGTWRAERMLRHQDRSKLHNKLSLVTTETFLVFKST